MRVLIRVLFPVIFAGLAMAATKPNIRLGDWMTVKLFVGPSETATQQIKVRPLYVRSRLREFTTGEPHDVTDRLFVIRRAYRVNDSLPDDDPKKIPAWRWQRGGWLMVDRNTGRISTLKNLLEFDPYYSNATWYRDYIAYCGVSEDGEILYAVVTQIGRKKPLVLKQLGAAHSKEEPESQCAPPKWQREPMRVTFEPVGSAPFTLQVHGRHVDAATERTNGDQDD
ncbi:MAG: hypothetical protein L0Z53_14770 [Acidobacteriales bacterium]|nr:hypothetical protein [Terriglobales bacterium]